MWVKICGVTSAGQLPTLISAAPDAVGLNFFAGSKRCVSSERAREIVAQLPDEIEPVGVFVNHSVQEIQEICRTVGLRTVQLHGDESWETVAQLGMFRVIRAFRVGQGGLDEVAAGLHSAAALGIQLFACLIDASLPGEYGGTGCSPPWDVLATGWQSADWPPLILAGGLTPANVREAIQFVQPWGVDVASGVESAPGVKDPSAVAGFVSSCRG